MGDKPPRIQNLYVTAEKFKIPRGMKDVIIPIEEDARIRLVFGSKRGKINWSVKAPNGLDLYGLLLCRRVVEMECRTRGFKGINWMVKNFELLQDTENIRLEGLQSVTFEGLEGILEKYYNKDQGYRREIRASIPTPIENIVALSRGGIPTFQVIQHVGLLVKKMDDSIEAQKNTNRLVSELTKVIGALANAQIRMQDSISTFIDNIKGEKN